MNEWRTEHLWCAMALSALEQQPAGGTWTVQVLAVVDPDQLPAAAHKATRRLRDLLARMQQPVDEPLPTWTSGGITLMRGQALPRATRDAMPEVGPLPLLVAGTPAQTDLPTTLLGFTATAPVLGLVAVVRGYVSAVEVASPFGAAASRTRWVWHGGGDQWPREVTATQAQPVVAAFATSVVSGEHAMLAYRVPAAGQQLPPSAAQDWVDLSRDGNLGFVSVLDNPELVLAYACGHPPVLPPEVEQAVFRPQWLVGRWWLHEVFEALRAWRAAGDPDADMGVPEPPVTAGASWAAVRADQDGDRLLGTLVSPAEARLLPDLLLAAATVSRTPAQSWLWQVIGDQLTDSDDAADTLRQIRGMWDQWPELHEPDRFYGHADSAFR